MNITKNLLTLMLGMLLITPTASQCAAEGKNDVNEHGHTPLHRAALHGKSDRVQILLDTKADIEATDKSGDTPLHLATMANNTETALLLLKKKANPNATGKGETTPLMLAACGGNEVLVDALLKQGADKNAVNRWGKRRGKTALEYAQDNGHAKVVDLLQLAPKSAQPITPTIKPKKLPEKATEKYDKHGNLPLHRAAIDGDLRSVQLLLDAGANIEALNQDGLTVLQTAIGADKIDIVHHLLNKKADPNAAEDPRFTPLVTAIVKGNAKIIKALLAHGADIEAKTKMGDNILIVAIDAADAASDNQAIMPVRLLLDHKINPETPDNKGYTPLMRAVCNGNLEIVKELLKRKVDINTKNNLGQTALQLANERKHFNIARLLLPPDETIPASPRSHAALEDEVLHAAARGDTDTLDSLAMQYPQEKFPRHLIKKMSIQKQTLDNFEKIFTHLAKKGYTVPIYSPEEQAIAWKNNPWIAEGEAAASQPTTAAELQSDISERFNQQVAASPAASPNESFCAKSEKLDQQVREYIDRNDIEGFQKLLNDNPDYCIPQNIDVTKASPEIRLMLYKKYITFAQKGCSPKVLKQLTATSKNKFGIDRDEAKLKTLILKLAQEKNVQFLKTTLKQKSGSGWQITCSPQEAITIKSASPEIRELLEESKIIKVDPTLPDAPVPNPQAPTSPAPDNRVVSDVKDYNASLRDKNLAYLEQRRSQFSSEQTFEEAKQQILQCYNNPTTTPVAPSKAELDQQASTAIQQDDKAALFKLLQENPGYKGSPSLKPTGKKSKPKSTNDLADEKLRIAHLIAKCVAKKDALQLEKILDENPNYIIKPDMINPNSNLSSLIAETAFKSSEIRKIIETRISKQNEQVEKVKDKLRNGESLSEYENQLMIEYKINQFDYIKNRLNSSSSIPAPARGNKARLKKQTKKETSLQQDLDSMKSSLQSDISQFNSILSGVENIITAGTQFRELLNQAAKEQSEDNEIKIIKKTWKNDNKITPEDAQKLLSEQDDDLLTPDEIRDLKKIVRKARKKSNKLSSSSATTETSPNVTLNAKSTKDTALIGKLDRNEITFEEEQELWLSKGLLTPEQKTKLHKALDSKKFFQSRRKAAPDAATHPAAAPVTTPTLTLAAATVAAPLITPVQTPAPDSQKNKASKRRTQKSDTDILPSDRAFAEAMQNKVNLLDGPQIDVPEVPQEPRRNPAIVYDAEKANDIPAYDGPATYKFKLPDGRTVITNRQKLFIRKKGERLHHDEGGKLAGKLYNTVSENKGNGCYTVDMNMSGNALESNSSTHATLFPPDWTQEEVLDKIETVVQDLDLSEPDKIDPVTRRRIFYGWITNDKIMPFFGIDNSMLIKIVFEPEDERSRMLFGKDKDEAVLMEGKIKHHIITAHPVLDLKLLAKYHHKLKNKS